MSIEAIVNELSAIAANPHGQLKAYKAEGKKCIGVMPYYAPEELVYAAGMVPFGMWGSNKKTISRAKEYCATFYCTIYLLIGGTYTPILLCSIRPVSPGWAWTLFGIVWGLAAMAENSLTKTSMLISTRLLSPSCWLPWLRRGPEHGWCTVLR